MELATTIDGIFMPFGIIMLNYTQKACKTNTFRRIYGQPERAKHKKEDRFQNSQR